MNGVVKGALSFLAPKSSAKESQSQDIEIKGMDHAESKNLGSAIQQELENIQWLREKINKLEPKIQRAFSQWEDKPLTWEDKEPLSTELHNGEGDLFLQLHADLGLAQDRLNAEEVSSLPSVSIQQDTESDWELI